MSGLITKATKKRSSASQTIRATKGKKSPQRKPQRPGKITAAPKVKKVTPAKKSVISKKSKPMASSSKAASRGAKKVIAKVTKVAGKKSAARPARQVAVPRKAGGKPVAKKAAAKSRAVGKPVSKAMRKAMQARRQAIIPKALPAPPKKPPSPGTLAAVRAFEQALRQFNRHDFGSAKSAFESLLDKFADQAEIVARARTYLSICEHRLGRAPSVPRNADALYNQGVFDLNRGNTSEAIELFEKALKVEPRADHVYYSLAAAYAHMNNAPKALDALRRAIGIKPVHRSHARRDLDLASLRTNEDFQQLTGFGFDLVDE